MQGRGSKKTNPRSSALRFLLLGAVLAGLAIVLQPDTISCSLQGNSQVCVHYIYGINGIDGQTLRIILGVLGVISLAIGAFFLRRHYKTQAEQTTNDIVITPQPVLSSQNRSSEESGADSPQSQFPAGDEP